MKREKNKDLETSLAIKIMVVSNKDNIVDVFQICQYLHCNNSLTKLKMSSRINSWK